MPDSKSPSSGSASPKLRPDPAATVHHGAVHAAAPDHPPLPSIIEMDYPVDWKRYRRTLRFAAWLFTRVFFWELILRRLLGNAIISQNRPRRFRRWAGEFRELAADMGGVMIKLGQFVSSRIDLLPPEITEELASLQDEVPTVAFDDIQSVLRQEIGDPADHFATLDRTPVAAASLGQAHKASLHNGDKVIVKIQRPGIRSIIFTDLKALSVVAQWAMVFRFIARRADVPALLDEFSGVMWEELDYTLEAANAQRFQDMFAQDLGIYIPAVYPEHSTQRVLTLEDVPAIKLSDYDAITATGVDRREVARRLVNTSLLMVFIERFDHSDPHPGNLLVYPLPEDSLAPLGRHASGQTLHGRPFYLIFIDFGMVGRLTPEIVAGLRETLAALTTRDAARLVRAYQRMGVLLPGADIDRIEEAARKAFDRVWGMDMDELNRMQFDEMAALGREFNDLLFELPFQVPQDYLYLGRAVGILFGMATGLDPRYDPWREVQPFVNQLLLSSGEFSTLNPLSGNFEPRDLLKPEVIQALLSRDGLDLALNTSVNLTKRAVEIPLLAGEVLRRMDRGEFTIRVTPTADFERDLHRVESATTQLSYAVIFAGLLIAGTILSVSGTELLAWFMFGLAGLTLLRVMWYATLR